MKNNKHTPGPWEANTGGSGEEGDGHVRTAYDYKGIDDKNLGKMDIVTGVYWNMNDAHLIAAAPEMLEALQFLCGAAKSAYWDAEFEMAAAEAIDQADAAIAKAKGES